MIYMINDKYMIYDIYNGALKNNFYLFIIIKIFI